MTRGRDRRAWALRSAARSPVQRRLPPPSSPLALSPVRTSVFFCFFWGISYDSPHMPANIASGLVAVTAWARRARPQSWLNPAWRPEDSGSIAANASRDRGRGPGRPFTLSVKTASLETPPHAFTNGADPRQGGSTSRRVPVKAHRQGPPRRTAVAAVALIRSCPLVRRSRRTARL